MRFVLLVLCCFLIAPNAVAQDEKSMTRDLRQLSKNIQHAQQQMSLIDAELEKLEADKKESQINIDQKRYELTKSLSAFHRQEQKPLYLSFLTPESSILDRYYNYRTRMTHNHIIKNTVENAVFAMNDIQEKIDAITRYKHDQTLLALTVEESLSQMERLSNKQQSSYSLKEFKLIVDDLEEQHETLNSLIQSLVKLPSAPPVKIKELSFILPVSGVVSNGTQAHSAISIASRPRAIVNAPASGRVLYAAPFKRLGSVIIINHGGGYVSMLRGFDRIFVSAGQDVSQNDPLGVLSQKTGTNTKGAMLYYELRYNGKVINPLTLLSGLEN